MTYFIFLATELPTSVPDQLVMDAFLLLLGVMAILFAVLVALTAWRNKP